MADARQHREKRARDQDYRATSPNPGAQVVQSLLGQVIGMSTATDAPASAVAHMSDPLARVAKSLKMSADSAIDHGQTSPISTSSFGSLDTPAATTATATATATAIQVAAPPMNAETAPPAAVIAVTPKASTLDSDAQNNDTRAFTFPGPLGATPNRGMSLPVPHGRRYELSTPQTRSPSISHHGSGSSSKRHKCPYCSTDFTRHHNLKSHLLTHSHEKPFECATCNSRFRRLHDLKRHSKLHTGERPHTCSKCGRRFARVDALARHNKGAGGCAGHRGSFGAPGSGDEAMDDGMDGLEYSALQTEEPERMDDDDDEPASPMDRRRSDAPPRSSDLPHPHPGGARATQTYPPLADARGMYPPPPGPASTTTTTTTSSSSHSSSSGSSSNQFGAPCPPSPMTTSPKPLSPVDASSSSHHHQQQQQHAQRGASMAAARGANFAPYAAASRRSAGAAHNANAPQLPSLPGLTNAAHPHPPPPPAGLLHGAAMGGGGGGASAGSSLSSSHGRSSGGSLREVLGGNGNGNGVITDVWAVVKDLEGKLGRMEREHGESTRLLTDEIFRLRQEVSSLKALQR